MAYTMRVYEAVTVGGRTYSCGIRVQLPSNLHFKEWEALVRMPDDVLTIDWLKFGFPVGYEGPMLTPATSNDSLALHRPCDVVAYVTSEVKDGAMLGP